MIKGTDFSGIKTRILLISILLSQKLIGQSNKQIHASWQFSDGNTGCGTKT
jgi:hypothetical protein